MFISCISGTEFFCWGYGTDKSGGFSFLPNSGTSWTAATTGLTHKIVLTLAFSGTNLFAELTAVFFLTPTTAQLDCHRIDKHLVSTLSVSGENIFAELTAAFFSPPTPAQAGLQSITA